MRKSNKRNLLITGLMGAGKSTVGRLVALELQREFIDTDEYLEKHYGPASDLLIQPNGDMLFQEVEMKIATELASRESLVISTGGRFMMNQANIDVMTEHCHIICLEAEIKDLITRLLSADPTTFRPRFDAASDKTQLMQSLQRQSKPYYKQFESLKTSGLLPEEVAIRVTKWFLRQS